MPWQEVVTVELRQQFVHDALRRVVSVTELCAGYGISRKTGYKWKQRASADGLDALAERSRRQPSGAWSRAQASAPPSSG